MTAIDWLAIARQIDEQLPATSAIITLDQPDGSKMAIRIPTERMRPAIKDFNGGRPQKGFGPHPGPAPSHRTRGSFAFRRWYAAYLRSADWAKRRDRVFQRAHDACEGCGEPGPTQVHHKTYDRVGNEFLFDLIAVCPACHTRLHGQRR